MVVPVTAWQRTGHERGVACGARAEASQTSAMATATSRKLRRRTMDHLRQKLWAVPAHLRLRMSRRLTAKPRPYRGSATR